jgi:hypothetical protein
MVIPLLIAGKLLFVLSSTIVLVSGSHRLAMIISSDLIPAFKRHITFLPPYGCSSGAAYRRIAISTIPMGPLWYICDRPRNCHRNVILISTLPPMLIVARDHFSKSHVAVLQLLPP